MYLLFIILKEILFVKWRGIMRLALILIFFQFSLNGCMSVWQSQGEEIIVEADIHSLSKYCLLYGSGPLIEFFRTQANISLDDHDPFFESVNDFDIKRKEKEGIEEWKEKRKTITKWIYNLTKDRMPWKLLCTENYERFKKKGDELYRFNLAWQAQLYTIKIILGRNLDDSDDGTELCYPSIWMKFFEKDANYIRKDENWLKQQKIIDIYSDNGHGKKGFYPPIYSQIKDVTEEIEDKVKKEIPTSLITPNEQKITVGIFFDFSTIRLHYVNQETLSFYNKHGRSFEKNNPCIPIFQYLQKNDISNNPAKNEKSLVALTEMQRKQHDEFEEEFSSSDINKFFYSLMKQLPKYIPIQVLIKETQFKNSDEELYAATFEHENIKYNVAFILGTDISFHNSIESLYRIFKQGADYPLEYEQELEQNKIIDLNSNNLHGINGFYKPDYSYSWRQKCIFGSVIVALLLVLYSQRDKLYTLH